jgi:hypothetical protein
MPEVSSFPPRIKVRGKLQRESRLVPVKTGNNRIRKLDSYLRRNNKNTINVGY